MEEFIILSYAKSDGKNFCFWCPDFEGYTDKYSEAGIYTKEQIEDKCHLRNRLISNVNEWKKDEHSVICKNIFDNYLCGVIHEKNK